MRLLAPLINPVVSSLPAGAVAGLQVMYLGVLYSFDGTTWIPVGQPSFTLKSGSAVIDVGVMGTPESYVDVTDANAVAGALVQGWISNTAAPTKDSDEAEMDVIDVWARIQTPGQINFRLTGLTGRIAGQFVVDYIIMKG